MLKMTDGKHPLSPITHKTEMQASESDCDPKCSTHTYNQ